MLTSNGANVDETRSVENSEWELSQFLDALAGELDRAQDTLSLKSFARGITVAPKELALELPVVTRVDREGRVRFRSAEPGEASGGLLKVTLCETFQAQLEEVRKPLDQELENWPLATLPGITELEVRALGRISIFTTAELRSLTCSPGLVAELARRTEISEAKLRCWVGLPFLSKARRLPDWPGILELSGGNLGEAPDLEVQVVIEGRVVETLARSPGMLTVRLPDGISEARVAGLVDGKLTNLLVFRPDEEERPVAPTEPELILEKTLSRLTKGKNPLAIFNIEVRNEGDATLTAIPVLDLFDLRRLEFVSAHPPPSSVSAEGSRGVLRWDRLAKLGPKSSRLIEVRFRTRPGKRSVRTRNLARLEGATDSSGRVFEPLECEVEVPLQSAGSPRGEGSW